MSIARPLGRIAPATWEHVERYPFAAPTPERVERILRLPRWRVGKYPHDQGREGSCVGHAVALERAITNAAELGHGVRYDPIALWRAAKAIDEWPATKPDDDRGTSVKAAYEIARTVGLARVEHMELENGRPRAVGAQAPSAAAGVSEYRWARTVDETRAAIAAGVPVAIGIDWFTGFDTPIARGSEFWLPASSLGRVRGGHSVALYGASDRREAFRLANSWGKSYPLVWMPYAALEQLLARNGEAALVTDRIGT